MFGAGDGAVWFVIRHVLMSTAAPTYRGSTGGGSGAWIGSAAVATSTHRCEVSGLGSESWTWLLVDDVFVMLFVRCVIPAAFL